MPDEFGQSPSIINPDSGSAAMQKEGEISESKMDKLKGEIETVLASARTKPEARALIRQVLMRNVEHGQYDDPKVDWQEDKNKRSVIVRVQLWNFDAEGNRFPVEIVVTYLAPSSNKDELDKQKIIYN